MPPTAGTATGRKGQSGAQGRKGAAGGKGAGKGAEKQKQQQQQGGGRAPTQDPDGEDTNAGFGKYLRSSEGIEMMKLFVIANTIVVFVTMAWPQMQQSYAILRSMIAGDEDGADGAAGYEYSV